MSSDSFADVSIRVLHTSPPNSFLPNPQHHLEHPSVTAKITFQAPPSILTSVPSYYLLLSHPLYTQIFIKAQKSPAETTSFPEDLFIFHISSVDPLFPNRATTQSNIDTWRCRRCLTFFTPRPPNNTFHPARKICV